MKQTQLMHWTEVPSETGKNAGHWLRPDLEFNELNLLSAAREGQKADPGARQPDERLHDW